MREMDFRYQLASNYKCRQCGSTKQSVELISLCGEFKKNLSKFDIFDMISASCQECGRMEFFDKYFLPETDISNKLSNTSQ